MEKAGTYLGAFGAARQALDTNRLSNRRGLVGDTLLFDKPARAQATQDVLAVASFGASADAVTLTNGQTLPIGRIADRPRG